MLRCVAPFFISGDYAGTKKAGVRWSYDLVGAALEAAPSGRPSRCAGAVYLGIVGAGDAAGHKGCLPPSVGAQWHRAIAGGGTGRCRRS